MSVNEEMNSRGARKRSPRLLIWTALSLAAGLLAFLGMNKFTQVRSRRGSPGIGSPEQRSMRSGSGGSGGPAGARVRRVDVELARPAVVSGTFQGGDSIDEAIVFVERSEQRDRADVDDEGYDSAWSRGFEIHADFGDQRRLLVRTHTAARRFTVEIGEADAARYAHRPAQLTLRGGGVVGTCSFLLPAPASRIDVGTVRFGKPVEFRARVIDEKGKPVSGALLYLYSRADVDVDALGNSRVAETDAAGHFSVKINAPAASLVIRAGGFLPRIVPWVSRDQSEASGIRQDLRLTRQRYAVRGMLRIRGASVADYTLLAVGRASARQRRSIALEVSDDGSFETLELGPGGYEVRLTRGVSHFSIAEFRVGTDEHVVDLGVLDLDLRGRIKLVDRSDALLPAEPVELYAEASRLDGENTWKYSGTLHVTGRATLWAPLPVGFELRYLRVTAPERLGRQELQLTDSVVIGNGTQSVDLEFVPVGEQQVALRALMRSERGFQPLRLARFEAQLLPDTSSKKGGPPPPPSGSGGSKAWSFRGTTSAVGQLKLPFRSTDRFSISFRSPTWNERRFWKGTAADAKDGNIVFEAADRELVVTLSDDERNPIADAFVQLVGDRSGFEGGVALRRTVRRAWTNSRGEAKFGRIHSAWDFGVQVRPGGAGGVGYRNAGRFVVTAGSGPFHAKIVLPGKNVSGLALRADGTPLIGRAVFVRRPRKGRRPLAMTSSVVTSATGAWSFLGLPPGTYELALVGPSGSGGEPEATSDRFTVEKSNTTHNLRFQGAH